MRLPILMSAVVLSTAALTGTASAAAAPYGSYLNSCRYAHERSGVLYAECRNESGRYQRTSISLRGCRGDIYNHRGNLYCRGSDRYAEFDDRYYDENRYYRGDDYRRHYRNPCGDDVALGTALGALGGAGLGAAINRGNDTGAAIGGAIVGGILGNLIARNQCNDNRYDAYYYERSRYNAVYRGRSDRWHNPHTGAYGEFRVLRSYRDYGYWDHDRWYRVDERTYRRNRGRYSEVTCREYVEIYRGPRGRYFEERRLVCNDGSTWRFVRH